MTTALIYLVVMVLVAAVVFLLASFVFGRGEELAPLPPGASPTRLPAADVTPDDVRDLRFQQVLRGYKMSEVDWVLERLAGELDALRTRVAELETGLVDGSGHGIAGTGPEGARRNGSAPASAEPDESELERSEPGGAGRVGGEAGT
nr:DivIVA domain-containing protein [Umezawaea beigongshangensis]